MTQSFTAEDAKVAKERKSLIAKGANPRRKMKSRIMIQLLKPGGRCAIVLPDGCITGDGYEESIRGKLLKDGSAEAAGLLEPLARWWNGIDAYPITR